MNDKSFVEWKKYIQSTGIPDTNESRLAIQTLKICIADNNMDDEFEQPKILNNGFALFDYTMYCYFVFRARLCQSFNRAFVELYDAYIQKLMSLYFYHFFDIPEKNIDRLISLRAIAYDEIVAANPENILTETLNLLCIFINNDFDNMPESDSLVISSIFVYYELYAKLSSYLPITMNLLDKQAELFEYAVKKGKNNPIYESKINPESIKKATTTTTTITSKSQKSNILTLAFKSIKSKLFCPKCNAKISFNSQYCHTCGYNIRSKCDSCGKTLKGNEVYCSKCGNKIKNEDK